MLRADRSVHCVYLHRAPIDMRKQMDGLAALVQGAMGSNAFSGSLYVFTNKRRDKLKMLVWDKSGFIVWYKRLEQEKFAWPIRATETCVTLTGEQLNWLLDGYDVWQMRPHQSLHFLSAA